MNPIDLKPQFKEGDRVMLSPHTKYRQPFYVKECTQLQGIGTVIEVDESLIWEEVIVYDVEWLCPKENIYKSNTYSKEDLVLATKIYHPLISFK